ncbi:MAG: heparan-alpha-glucosaminide N-acetyltransferase domain-containing protein [Microbacterium sp.]
MPAPSARDDPSRTAGRLRRLWERFDGARGREPGIDLARGLAIVGMLAAHLTELPALSWADPTTWAGIASGRSSILFAVLAGVSVAVVTGGSRRIGPELAPRARARLAVRAACIWALGIVLALTPVPIYGILPAYGILFLLALPAIRWRAGTLLAVAVGLAVAGPLLVRGIDSASWGESPAGLVVETATGWHYPFVLWAAFLAAGMAIGRLPLGDARVSAGLVVAGVGLVVLGDGAIGSTGIPSGLLSAGPHSSGIGEAVGSGGFAIATIGACILLCRTPVRWIAIPVRAVGTMPLTAYMSQYVVWIAATAGAVSPLEDFRAQEPFWPFAIAALAACTAWALLVGRGPLEAAIGRVSRDAVAWIGDDDGRQRRGQDR